MECSKTAVAHLMRVSWRTVGRILEWVATRLEPKGRRRLAGLRRIGIDEISFRKGHRYLTVVVDRVSGRLLWAAEGRDEETLRRFFVELGRSRCRGITHVSADGHVCGVKGVGPTEPGLDRLSPSLSEAVARSYGPTVC